MTPLHVLAGGRVADELVSVPAKSSRLSVVVRIQLERTSRVFREAPSQLHSDITLRPTLMPRQSSQPSAVC